MTNVVQVATQRQRTWQRSLDDLPQSVSYPAPKWFLAFVFIFPLMPSPAIVPIYQVIFAGIGVLGAFNVVTRSAAVTREHRDAQATILRRCVALIVLSAVSYVVNNPSIDVGVKSALIRGLFFLFVAFGALFLSSMNERDFRRLFRTFVYGVALLSLVAVFISLTRLNITGEKIRPSRGIGLLPSGIKTAGTPRSYGEYAIILSGGISALIWMWKDYRVWVRWSLLTAMIFGVSVSHSRNAYLATILTIAVSLYPVVRRRSTQRARSRVIMATCYGAIASPFFISLFLGSAARDSFIGQYFVGDGIFEENVESRGDHVTVGLSALFNEPGGILRGISFDRWVALTYDTTIPHNHFVSVIIFGVPVLAVLIIYLVFVRWVRVLAHSRSREDYFLGAWLAGTLFAISNYQGLFSPAMALLLSAIFSIKARAILANQQSAASTQGRGGTRRSATAKSNPLDRSLAPGLAPTR